MGKVRIYDLAKELKLESKKVLEDARRLGVDASVPSNTLPDVVAAKIREMYYPKKEPVAAKPTRRLIKCQGSRHRGLILNWERAHDIVDSELKI